MQWLESRETRVVNLGMFRDRGCQLKCSELLADTEPWLGQFGKLRKRRVLTKKKSVEVESSVDKDQTAVTTTRRGHKVLKPARFMTISSDSQGRLSLKEGGSCKDQTGRRPREGSRDRRRENWQPRGSSANYSINFCRPLSSVFSIVDKWTRSVIFLL